MGSESVFHKTTKAKQAKKMSTTQNPRQLYKWIGGKKTTVTHLVSAIAMRVIATTPNNLLGGSTLRTVWPLNSFSSTGLRLEWLFHCQTPLFSYIFMKVKQTGSRNLENMFQVIFTQPISCHEMKIYPKDLGPSNGFGWTNLYDAEVGSSK